MIKKGRFCYLVGFFFMLILFISTSSIISNSEIKVSGVTINKIDGYHHIEGDIFIETPGSPRLPVEVVLHAMPDDKDIRINVDPGKSIVISDINLYPNQEPKLLHHESMVSEEVKLIAEELEQNRIFSINQTIYQDDSQFPSRFYDITLDAYLRDQRFVAIHLFKFQYNPVQKTLTYYPNLTWDYEYVCKPDAQVIRKDYKFDSLNKQLFSNYESQKTSQIGITNVKANTWEWQGTKSLKIYINETKPYILTYTALDAVGFDLTGDPRKLNMTSNGLLLVTYS